MSRPFIGFYGFWAALTFLSVASAIAGMRFALGGDIGYAIVCLMVCGLCDMFDGTVARRAKRTKREEGYGIHLDSLADIVSFGALPVVIGYAASPHYLPHNYGSIGAIASIVVSAIYVLAALVRLSYYTVIEVELQSKNEKRTYYEGLPVTFVALIIPIVYSICLFFGIAFSTVYNAMLFIISVLFVLRVRLPAMKGYQRIVLLFIGLPIIVYLVWNIGAGI